MSRARPMAAMIFDLALISDLPRKFFWHRE
jgi:hypothetical protein